MVLNYVINSKTLAILPYGTRKSIVIENNDQVIVNKSPIGIIRQNCILYGSCIEEKWKKTELLTGIVYKSPVMISYHKKLILFPTVSPRLRECVWISPFAIKSHKFDHKKSMSCIEFLCGKTIYVTSTTRIIDNQILRASKIMSLCSIKPSFL